MTRVTIGQRGEMTLPRDVQERYSLSPNTPLRVIETRSGILLVPLTETPMTPELAQELQEWQTLGAESWEEFTYEEGTE